MRSVKSVFDGVSGSGEKILRITYDALDKDRLSYADVEVITESSNPNLYIRSMVGTGLLVPVPHIVQSRDKAHRKRSPQTFFESTPKLETTLYTYSSELKTEAARRLEITPSDFFTLALRTFSAANNIPRETPRIHELAAQTNRHPSTVVNMALRACFLANFGRLS